MPDAPDHLREALVEVRRAYPDGVPDQDRAALLVALADEMSERNVGELMWAWQGDEPVVVQNELAAAMSRHRPAADQVEAARQRLRAAR